MHLGIEETVVRIFWYICTPVKWGRVKGRERAKTSENKRNRIEMEIVRESRSD